MEKEFVKDPSNPSKYIKHHYPSVSAPVRKAGKIGAPILSSLYIMDALSSHKKNKLAKQMGLTRTEFDYLKELEKKSHVKEGIMADGDKILVSKAEIEKTAAALRKAGDIKKKSVELEKTAALKERAAKVAFSLVERGSVPTFKNFEDFQEKVASLMEQDLDVVEKALELNTQDLVSFNGIGERSKGGNPLRKFCIRRLIKVSI